VLHGGMIKGIIIMHAHIIRATCAQAQGGHVCDWHVNTNCGENRCQTSLGNGNCNWASKQAPG